MVDDAAGAQRVVDLIQEQREEIARLTHLHDLDHRLADNRAEQITMLEARLRAVEAERDDTSAALMAVLLAQPMANGQYVHLVTCSGDRREPAGKPGHSCSCAIAPRSLVTKLEAETRRLREAIDLATRTREAFRPLSS